MTHQVARRLPVWAFACTVFLAGESFAQPAAPVATAPAPNAPAVGDGRLRLGEGLEMFIVVKSGGLTDGQGVSARMQHSDPSVFDAEILGKSHLRFLGKKVGAAELTVRTIDKKTHRYRVEVVPVDQAPADPARQRLELGLGQAMLLPAPEGFRNRGSLSPMVSGSNDSVVDYEYLGSHAAILGRKAGVSDVSFLAGDGKLTLYRVHVAPRAADVAAEGKKRVDVKVDGAQEIELPSDYRPKRDKILVAGPSFVKLEVTSKANLKCTGVMPGVCDIVVVYKSEPTMYRVVIAGE